MVTQSSMFVEERTGRLMRLEESELTRYEYEIWFEYTRTAMAQVREGAMVAVANFASVGTERHLSILEITSLRPVHYALGDNPEGYPGFVMEAAKNASQDWSTQEDRSDEDTTIIRCGAIPTNLEIVLRPNEEPRLEPEQNIPMIGADARLLATSLVQRVVNRGITQEAENIAVAGTLLRDQNVRVLVRVEDFMKVHFGIFGFTGVGKSNLVSTIVANVIPAITNSKVVLFDLMGEYGILLLDRLNNLDDGYIICLGDRSLPEGVLNYINSAREAPDLRVAAQQLVNFFLLPKALIRYRENLINAFEVLLQREKIRLYSDVQSARVNDVCDVQTERNPWRFRQPGRRPAQDITQIVRRVFGRYYVQNPPLSSHLAIELREQLKEILSSDEYTDYEGDFQFVLDYLEEVSEVSQETPPCAISRDEILNILNRDEQALIIVISNNPNELRRFSHRIGEAAYENRRLTGHIEPLVSFIFDEADEFIPRDATGTYAESREIAETLARRGRKFGLGLGIATQRTRYLDTSIMAQPHTYLVSKLPRRSDRDVVTEAFGMSEEMLRQTFVFQTGNWLIVSHDATGLKSVPVPIYAEDANQRIINYLGQLSNEGS